MQSAKGQFKYKFEQFEVSVAPFADKKLGITIIDPCTKSQFKEPMLELTKIGTATLLKALQQTMIEIKMAMKVIKSQNNTVLKIDILVASQFLKPVEQTIYLKRTKQMNQSDIMKSSMERLGRKLKELKQTDDNINQNALSCVRGNNKTYNNNAQYQPIATLSLPKGKYILTLSFMVKATSLWMYVYFGSGGHAMQNAGFYVNNGSYFLPIIIRKEHSVVGDKQSICFNTYYAQSYPITLKNTILTAQKVIKE